MHVLFPSDYFKASEPDADFADEANAARAVGFDIVLFAIDPLQQDSDVARALARCAPAPTPNTSLLYRGWMLRDNEYELLYRGLVERGYAPITDPVQYAEAHYLPNAYPYLKGETPQTRWMEGADRETAWELYQQRANVDTVLKDYVKSAKHRWHEACFIPAYTGRERFEKMVTNFEEARGEPINKGLVLRDYRPPRLLHQDPRGFPVHEEYRLFFYKGTVFAHAPFLNPSEAEARIKQWHDVAARFSNRFISMDVAPDEDGDWIIIEVGDGGVSGLPASVTPEAFYTALYQAIEKGK